LDAYVSILVHLQVKAFTTVYEKTGLGVLDIDVFALGGESAVSHIRTKP